MSWKSAVHPCSFRKLCCSFSLCCEDIPCLCSVFKNVFLTCVDLHDKWNMIVPWPAEELMNIPFKVLWCFREPLFSLVSVSFFLVNFQECFSSHSAVSKRRRWNQMIMWGCLTKKLKIKLVYTPNLSADIFWLITISNTVDLQVLDICWCY